jgi:hypothetical protein
LVLGLPYKRLLAAQRWANNSHLNGKIVIQKLLYLHQASMQQL